MKTSVYNLKEMEQFLSMSEGLYDIVRLVDPVECRQVAIEDGHLKFLDGCYNVWESSARCKHCSSYKACRSGARHRKQEYFDGNVYNILSNPVKLVVQDGTILDCVIEFITAHKAADSEKDSINDRRAETEDPASLIDSLTQLYNWDGFHQRARALLDSHRDSSCIIAAFDISHFKLVNSIFGRQKGDDILIETANILKHFSSPEAIVARIQSDQFAMCMPQALWDEASILNRLDSVRNLIDDSAFSIEVFAGVYTAVDKELPIATMYDRAVMAYIASFGGNKHQRISYFDESMMDELLYQQDVTGNFERNLADGQFHIFIQPQVDETGHVYGGEALCRWIKPEEGIVPPFRFIPILENAGLIAKLDRHVWELAAKQLDAWKDTPYSDMYISVNISPMDFYYIDVYDAITGLVEKYNIDKSKLKLEITETAIMSDVEKQILRVADLRNYGFTVEIDDFGAGYSSLALLKDIEADVLKIDMAFLQETENKDRSRKVLKSIIQMAGRLHMETITEGVEMPEQVAMLSEMGCNRFQGFYFAKPMPVDEFESYVKERNL